MTTWNWLSAAEEQEARAFARRLLFALWMYSLHLGPPKGARA